MTRLALIALAAWALLAGCDKPKPEDCRKALLNMQHLLGTENLSNEPAALEGEVRRCRGGSKRKAVECAIKAQTLDELRACDFYKLPDKATKGGGPAPAPAGSAATGSAVAPTGSAAAAAPAGSAAAGSAAAPAGSPGSAAATGSAGSAK